MDSEYFLSSFSVSIHVCVVSSVLKVSGKTL